MVPLSIMVVALTGTEAAAALLPRMETASAKIRSFILQFMLGCTTAANLSKISYQQLLRKWIILIALFDKKIILGSQRSKNAKTFY